ncbi:MAG TPA: hypothetical protein DD641_03480 [Deltaproteobacteria bacterium]|nr:hypothetical protein [Deltaproteobacteria bacterium]
MKRLVLMLIIVLMPVFSLAVEPIKIPKRETFVHLKRDPKEFKEIKAVFDDLLTLARKGDIEGIIKTFSKNYINSGRDLNDAKKQWETIIKNFTNLELSHPIFSIEASGNFARMRCEGTLMGKPKRPIPGETEESIIIDSWSLGSHNLIKEDGKWKILGDQVPFDTGRTFHPLF